MPRRFSATKILTVLALILLTKLLFFTSRSASSAAASTPEELEIDQRIQQVLEKPVQQVLEKPEPVPARVAAPKETLPAWTPKAGILEDVEVLKGFGLTSKFEYRRICMTATPRAFYSRSSVYNTKTAFFSTPEGTIISSDGLGNTEAASPSGCSLRVNVDVPYFDKNASVDTSALFLGMATTLPRLSAALPSMSRWLSNTGTTLQVLIVDHAELESVKTSVDEIKLQAFQYNIKLLFAPYMYPWESDGRKSFGLAEHMRDNAPHGTKWHGIIDDDTFFFSLPQMLAALEKFDHNEHHYIGALSEGISRVAKEGFKAAGGAGFFLSPGLMTHLANNMNECRELEAEYGDLLWRDCIVEFTSPTVPLTQLRGLNQMDFWKDPSGWYESYLNPIYTIHHWKSWHYHPIPLAHLVTDVAGPDSLLQRYGFLDDTVLSNGYSLVHYPHGEPDLKLTELTMVEDVGQTEYPPKQEFLHAMGGTRKAMKMGRTKVQWKFETAINALDGSVKQFYVKKAETRQGQNIDSVIQIDWQTG